MKYLIYAVALVLFCSQPANNVPAQSKKLKTSIDPAIENKMLKEIKAIQEQTIAENKDSITALNEGILSGQIKPKAKVIYRTRYRTRAVPVYIHDTIFAMPDNDHMAADFIAEPCPPDTIEKEVQAIMPHKSLLQKVKSIFNHKK